MLDLLRQILNSRIRIYTSTFLLILVAFGIFINRSPATPKEETLNWFVSWRLNEMHSKYEQLTAETFVGRDQEDQALVEYIRNHEMYKPSILPYNLLQPNRSDYSQYHQSKYADDNFLHGMTGGFFLEAGALDGEDKSNSLYFEKYKGWTGLLVEPDPSLFRHLSTLNRKAYSINAGFSLNNQSKIETFEPKRGLGKIIKNAARGIRIRTFPLYSMLLALKVNQVDFFSLDIEGFEESVLYTIPWEKVKFRLICMEVNKFKGGRSVYVKFFEDRGYTYLGLHDIDAWFGWRELLKETMDVDAWLSPKNKKRIH